MRETFELSTFAIEGRTGRILERRTIGVWCPSPLATAGSVHAEDAHGASCSHADAHLPVFIERTAR